MYDELLLALDGDDAHPLAPVAALARRLDVALSAVCVEAPYVESFPDEVWLRDLLAGAGTRVGRTFVVCADDAGEALVELARERPRSLLCMGSSGRGPVGEVLLGSVSADVVHRSTRAVLLVGPSCRVPEHFEVVALAPGPADDHQEAAAVLAAHWALHLGARVLELDAEDDLDPDAAITVVTARTTALPGHPVGAVGRLVHRARQPVLVVGPHVTLGSTVPADEGT